MLEENIELSDLQLEQFYKYMNILVEWNKFMNLTGITEPKEVITKHFIDSLTVLDKVDKNASVIDVGTGAGFPGIPLKIMNKDKAFTLIDSVNKKLNVKRKIWKMSLSSSFWRPLPARRFGISFGPSGAGRSASAVPAPGNAAGSADAAPESRIRGRAANKTKRKRF